METGLGCCFKNYPAGCRRLAAGRTFNRGDELLDVIVTSSEVKSHAVTLLYSTLLAGALTIDVARGKRFLFLGPGAK